MRERENRHVRDVDHIGRADDRLGGERGHERGGEHRPGDGERIRADDQLESVEGAGQRRAEGRRDRAAGAAAHQHAQILAAQPPADAEPRGEAAADLGVAGLEADRRAATVRQHRLRRDEQALLERHAAAAQRVRLDRVHHGGPLPARAPEIDGAERKARQHRRGESGDRRDPRGGAEARIERNAVDHDMRDIDDQRHHADGDARERADDDRQRDQPELAAAQRRAELGDDDKRPPRRLHRGVRRDLAIQCGMGGRLCAARRFKQGASALGERHVVAMDHLGAAARAEEARDVARIASANPLGVQGVEGDEAAADLRPALVANGDAVAA